MAMLKHVKWARWLHISEQLTSLSAHRQGAFDMLGQWRHIRLVKTCKRAAGKLRWRAAQMRRFGVA